MAQKFDCEHIPLQIFPSPKEIYETVAQKVADLIRTKTAAGKTTVLCLPTGNTPIGVYQQLVKLHKEEGLSFKNVVTFNLDEYYPMEPTAIQSYHLFMHENLFNHIDIPKENINILDGTIPRDQIDSHCHAYEDKIRALGGFDLVLLGIGRDGHIAFNEPGSDPSSRTRLVVLDAMTRKDAASTFYGEKNVPHEALTMGVGTILSGREIILMATGEGKYRIVQKAVEGRATPDVPATFLHSHPKSYFFVDRAAAMNLARVRTPWVMGDCQWGPEMTKRAVIHVARTQQKAILDLDISDFHANHLHELVGRYGGDADQLTTKVFLELQSLIQFPKDIIKGKKVIVFSPHPDDDVICMGTMLDRLKQNGNDITVAYMTNGSVAVSDGDVRRHLRYAEMSADLLFNDSAVAAKAAEDGIASKTARTAARVAVAESKKRILDAMATKAPADPDAPEIQVIKGNIRCTEALSALEVFGIGEESARFLDLPFYRTGLVQKDPISKLDIDIVLKLLEEVQPEHIFVAGDLTDPHGTHRMCYFAIYYALEIYNRRFAIPKDPSTEEDQRPQIWLYRGAWQEWEPHEVSVFLPMSKSDLDKKIMSIFKHQSQKDKALYPGSDSREFWQRARDRNMTTAADLDKLGLPKFFAVEAFVCTRVMPS